MDSTSSSSLPRQADVIRFVARVNRDGSALVYGAVLLGVLWVVDGVGLETVVVACATGTSLKGLAGLACPLPCSGAPYALRRVVTIL